jgi:dolichol-phosphate mannosyltransferase
VSGDRVGYLDPAMDDAHLAVSSPPQTEAPPQPLTGSGLPGTASSRRERAGHHARRVRLGLKRPHNWMQLVKFSAVGATGYVINLAAFAALVEGAGVHYRTAAVLAFCVAVTNNFLWNRHWTFKATHGHAGFQAARFLTVSLFALGFNLIVLEVLVSVVGAPKIPAQAVAVLAATPLNFVGNKLWSFGKPASRVRSSAVG